MTVKVVSTNPLFGKVPFEYAPGWVFTPDPACTDYDWLVVFDDLKRDETVACPRVGIAYAEEKDREAKWRFVDKKWATREILSKK